MEVQMYSEPAAREPQTLQEVFGNLVVFICTDHAGFWQAGVASVVIAENEKQARELLDLALDAKKLKTSVEKPYILLQLAPIAQAVILKDGLIR